MTDFQEELEQSVQGCKWYEKELERLDVIIS